MQSLVILGAEHQPFPITSVSPRPASDQIPGILSLVSPHLSTITS